MHFLGGGGSFYLRICRGGGVNCTSGPPYIDSLVGRASAPHANGPQFDSMTRQR